MYCNQKKNPLTDKNSVLRIYLQNNDYCFQIELKDIQLVSRHFLDKKYYYLYQFTFVIPFQHPFIMRNASIHFYLMNEKHIEMNIGEFSYYHVEEYHSMDWGISTLKAIVNTVQNKKVVVGILLHFYNMTSEEITIHLVSPLNPVMENKQLIAVDESSIASSTSINNWLLEPYGTFSKPITGITFQNEVNILAVVYYNELYQIPTFALKIDYNVNEEVKTAYLETFTYFHDHQQDILLSEIVFYRYENN
ncbi:MAG: hypothetical protein PHP41_03880 [Bacilli bacterium]|nr:hypothetical protein [Bacilli bacterium]MDY0063452.1 hypothetical protein [Bacilli bacterium]